MMEFFNTLHFLKLMHGKKLKPIKTMYHTIQANNNISIDIMIKQPLHKKNKGTILFIHGMNKHGFNDPRVLDLNHVFAQLGYRAIIPNIPSIQNLIMEPLSQTSIIKAVIKYYSKEQPLAIFSVSFSGGAVIANACDPMLSKHINTVLAIGTYFNPLQTLTNLLTRKDGDYYGRLIILKNLYLRAHPNDCIFEQCINLAIDDDFEDREEPLLTPYLDSLSAEDKNRVEKTLNLLNHPQKLIKKYQKELNSINSDYRYKNKLNNHCCPLQIIHSSLDKVISDIESQQLKVELDKQGIKNKLLITSLLDHVDLQLNLKTIKQFIQLVFILRQFFKLASKDYKNAELFETKDQNAAP